MNVTKAFSFKKCILLPLLLVFTVSLWAQTSDEFTEAPENLVEESEYQFYGQEVQNEEPENLTDEAADLNDTPNTTDTTSYNKSLILRLLGNKALNAVSFANTTDMNFITLGYEDGILSLFNYDLIENKYIEEKYKISNSAITDIEINTDLNMIFTYTQDGYLYIWNNKMQGLETFSYDYGTGEMVSVDVIPQAQLISEPDQSEEVEEVTEVEQPEEMEQTEETEEITEESEEVEENEEEDNKHKYEALAMIRYKNNDTVSFRLKGTVTPGPYILGASFAAGYTAYKLIQPFYFGGFLEPHVGFPQKDFPYKYQLHGELISNPIIIGGKLYAPFGICVFPFQRNIEFFVDIAPGIALNMLWNAKFGGDSISSKLYTSFYASLRTGASYKNFSVYIEGNYDAILGFGFSIGIGYSINLSTERRADEVMSLEDE